MEKVIGQRWMWTDNSDKAVGEIVCLPASVKVVQVISGGISGSGSGINQILTASWDYKGISGTGGWFYLEGQDAPNNKEK